MTVTPGVTIQEGEEITEEKLNMLGNPTVAMDDADVEEVRDAVLAEVGAGLAGRNYFLNPGLDLWSRGAGPVNLALSVREELADAWWSRCNSLSSAQPTYERVASTFHQEWIYGAKLVGETGVGTVDFGQDLAAHVSAGLGTALTITFDLYNATGAAIIPQVRLDGCNAFEDYSAVTNLRTGNGASVANATLATVTVTLDTSGVAASLRNGAQLCIRLPSGALSSAAKSVQIFALKVEASSNATSRYPERDLTPVSNAGTTSEGTQLPNWLKNGDFSSGKGIAVVCTEDLDNFNADHWAANPADGSDLDYTIGTQVPTGAKVLRSATLTGDTNTTGEVDFAQNIPAEIAAGMQELGVFSIYIYNGTGTAFSPSLRLHTCDTYNNFAATTSRATSSAASCANGAWTRLELAFNGATATNLSNGARLIVRFPAGTLDSSGKLVRLTQAQLEPGTAATDYVPRIEPQPIATAARNLSVTTTATAQLTITADELVLMEPGGATLRLRNQALTLDVTVSGAGGLDTGTTGSGDMYDLYVISTGVTTNTLAVLDGDTPVMPAGYWYKARIGSFQAGGGAINPIVQRGNIVMCKAKTLFAGTVTTSDTYQTVSLATEVPSWAGAMSLQVQIEEEANLKASLKAVSSGFDLAEQILVCPSVGAAASYGSVYASARASLPVAGTPDLRFKASDNTRDYRINLLGWTLP